MDLYKEIEGLRKKVDVLLDIMSNQQDWLSIDQFCKTYDIPRRSFHKYQQEGTLVTKKIGKHVFVSLSKSMAKL